MSQVSDLTPERTDRIDFTSLPRAEISDDGGKRLDALLLTTPDVIGAVRDAVEQGFAVMPAGGLTSAINSFAYDRADIANFRDVVAIRPKAALKPQILPPNTPISQIQSNQVSIDAAAGTITAGVGVTFEQVNRVLAEAVSPNARVLIDLTSIGSAWVGGVVATGGMGPMRLRPSLTCQEICVADGRDDPLVISGPEIADYEGMQGWLGMTTAVQMRFFEVPPLEFGLVLPIQSTDIDAMASLLAYLHSWSQINLPGTDNRLISQHPENTVLNGIELVSRASLEQFIAHAAEPAKTKAQGLLQSCEYAGADMLACLTGWSDAPVDEVLGILLDEETETIGGVAIDFGVGFSSGSEMDTFRAIREGAPDTARTQARVTPPGKLRPWSASTDVNVALPRDVGAIASVLTVYDDYRKSIAALGQKYAGKVEVSLAAYGHLSPQGLDPHHRVTLLAAEGEQQALDEAVAEVGALKRELIRSIVQNAEGWNYRVTGGEKGMPSVVEIARAVGGIDAAPDSLRQAILSAREAVCRAPRNFSFRAPPELRS